MPYDKTKESYKGSIHKGVDKKAQIRRYYKEEQKNIIELEKYISTKVKSRITVTNMYFKAYDKKLMEGIMEKDGIKNEMDKKDVAEAFYTAIKNSKDLFQKEASRKDITKDNKEFARGYYELSGRVCSDVLKFFKNGETFKDFQSKFKEFRDKARDMERKIKEYSQGGYNDGCYQAAADIASGLDKAVDTMANIQMQKDNRRREAEQRNQRSTGVKR